ncbi:MAG: GbsR/MarR family transcriptional regulator [Limisphaerales bacterium]
MNTLTPVQQKFILHWGKMGAQWGINRTVAQIHALLYVSPAPIDAEIIANTLGVARSNVSTSLRELEGWGIVRTVHVLGDRRDHYESLKDVWEMFRIVMDERKKREMDPTLAMLRECAAEAASSKDDKYTKERLDALLEFFEATSTWYDQIRKLPIAGVRQFMKLGDRVMKLVGKTGG